MENLRNQAIVLIYPDGIVEKIPFKKGISAHLDYFHDWLKVSKKFAKVIYHSPYKITFKDWEVLDKALTEAEIIVIRNLEMYELNYDMSIVDSEKPFEFLVNLPLNYKQTKAYLPYKEIREKNEKESFSLGIYSPEIGYFDDIEDEFLDEDLEKEEIKR